MNSPMFLPRILSNKQNYILKMVNTVPQGLLVRKLLHFLKLIENLLIKDIQIFLLHGQSCPRKIYECSLYKVIPFLNPLTNLAI